MRTTIVGAGILLLTACAHANTQPEPTAGVAGESSERLGQLQPTSTASAPRHEPGAPDPQLTAGAARPTAPAANQSSDSQAAPGSPAQSAAADAPQLSREESALRERIQRRLLQDKRLSYTAQRVRLDVKRGDVTVQGEVRTAREKREVEEVIGNIAGVRRVDNQLAVIDQTNPDAASGLQTP